jgi:hypothetical protein
MLELLSQLDGFSSNDKIKVQAALLHDNSQSTPCLSHTRPSSPHPRSSLPSASFFLSLSVLCALHDDDDGDGGGGDL